MTTFKSLIDSVVSDIETNVGPLPEHNTWRYVEPNGLRADLGPWLAVYPQRIRPELISTDSNYQHDRVIVVRWTLEAFDAAALNRDAEQDAEAGLVAAEAILDRLETYGAGIPDHTESGVLEESVFRLRQGPTWNAEFVLRIEEFA